MYTIFDSSNVPFFIVPMYHYLPSIVSADYVKNLYCYLKLPFIVSAYNI